MAGDFNGDGRLDLAVAASGFDQTGPLRTSLRSCWATATAPSSHHVIYSLGPNPGILEAGDFNGDGRLDLAAFSIRYPVGRHTSRSCWATATAPSSPPIIPILRQVEASSIVAGDFNGDGQLDLAVAANLREYSYSMACTVLWATATAHSSPR